MSNRERRRMKTPDKVFWVLWFVGVLWGIFGWYLMPAEPPLVFGWLPLTLLSLALNAIAATVLFAVYFYRYWEGRD